MKEKIRIYREIQGWFNPDIRIQEIETVKKEGEVEIEIPLPVTKIKNDVFPQHLGNKINILI